MRYPEARGERFGLRRDQPVEYGAIPVHVASLRRLLTNDALQLDRIARGGTFLAFLPEVSEPAGLAGGYQEDRDTAELVSMYVRPQARGRGVGEALVAAVARWAEAKGAKSLHLWVTEANAPARQLYERCGFSPTPERQPLPSNPALGELGMTLIL